MEGLRASCPSSLVLLLSLGGWMKTASRGRLDDDADYV